MVTSVCLSVSMVTYLCGIEGLWNFCIHSYIPMSLKVCVTILSMVTYLCLWFFCNHGNIPMSYWKFVWLLVSMVTYLCHTVGRAGVWARAWWERRMRSGGRRMYCTFCTRVLQTDADDIQLLMKHHFQTSYLIISKSWWTVIFREFNNTTHAHNQHFYIWSEVKA